MDEKQTALFEAYLNEELNKEAKENFEKRLKEDIDFQHDFNLYQNIFNTLASRHKHKEEELNLRKTLNTIQNTKQEKEPKLIKMFSMKKILIAASIALLVTLSIFNFNSKPSYSDYANYDSLSLTVRGENDGVRKLLEKYFNNKQFRKALPLFESLLKDNPNDNKLIFYNALALLETDKIDKSIVLLDQLIDGKNTLYKDNALWYKSLAYLKVKDYKACKDTLLLLDENSEYYDEVQELLKDLN